MNDDRVGVCLVSDEFFPITPGGIGRVVRSVLQNLVSEGFDAHLLFFGSPSDTQKIREDVAKKLPSLEVWSIEDFDRDPIPPDFFRSESYARSYQIWKALEEIALRRSIDVVEFVDFHGPGYVSIKAKRLGLASPLKAQFVVRVHGTAELIASSEGRWAASPRMIQMAQCERYAIRHADRLILPSNEFAEWMSHRYRLPSAKRWIVRPPPCSLPTPLNSAQLRDGARLDLLFVGKIQPVKGILELSREVLHFANKNGSESIRLHVVGRDETHGEFERSIPRSLRNTISLCGQLTSEQIGRLAQTCHAAVFPSRMEAFCLSAHEMKARGLPLILSAIPAFEAYFKSGGDSLFFEGFETCRSGLPSLRQLLQEVVENRGTLGTLSENGSVPSYETSEQYARSIHELLPDRAELENSRRVEGGDPRISFVIPYFEMEEFLEETLASVEATRGVDWEAIVVDDGSRSRGAREKFHESREKRENDLRFVFLEKKNEGLSSARNLGVTKARGDYILPLDADDCVDPEYASTAVSALDRNPELGFVSCIARVFEDSDNAEKFPEWFVPYDSFAPLLYLENGVGTAACVFRRQLLREHLYDESLPSYEDWDLQLNLSGRGVEGEVLPRVLHGYRFRRASMVRAVGHKRHRELLERMVAKRTHPDWSIVLQAMAIELYRQNATIDEREIPSGIEPGSGKARIFAFSRSVYQRWLVPVAERWLSGSQQARLVRRIKRIFFSRLW